MHWEKEKNRCFFAFCCYKALCRAVSEMKYGEGRAYCDSRSSRKQWKPASYTKAMCWSSKPMNSITLCVIFLALLLSPGNFPLLLKVSPSICCFGGAYAWVNSLYSIEYLIFFFFKSVVLNEALLLSLCEMQELQTSQMDVGFHFSI